MFPLKRATFWHIAAVYTGGYDRQTLESTESESATAHGRNLFLNKAWTISSGQLGDIRDKHQTSNHCSTGSSGRKLRLTDHMSQCVSQKSLDIEKAFEHDAHTRAYISTLQLYKIQASWGVRLSLEKKSVYEYLTLYLHRD